ncbi:MAG: Crp/Fnr family transcriptional regulator [Bacteroidetes bacterium]|nr:Crp/Fnr family transcriptional regulator [Bacteroidota bacterium]
MPEIIKSNHCKTCIYNRLLFGGLNDNELNLLNRNKKEMLFKKGEIISTEGQDIASFLYLKQGLVKLYKQSPNNKDQIISIAKPRDFISLLSMFSLSTYKYSISALEDSVVCSVEMDALKEVIKNNGTFAIDIMKKMSKMYDDIIENRFEINKKHLRGRIAYILIFFSTHIYQSDEFELPVSRREIAELIEMTTENVIRILSEFRKDKIIQIDGKRIKLLDPERLESVCRLG